MKFVMMFLTLLLCGNVSAGTNDVIRNVAELLQVVTSKGLPGGKFTIEGTVYSVPPKRKSSFFIVKDGLSVPIIDFRKEDAPPISSGDRILASGTIDPQKSSCPNGYVNANCREAVTLGRDSPIKHIPITADDIRRQDLLFRPVRIVGTLVDMRVDDIDPNFTIFVLDCSNRIVYAESQMQHDNLRTQIGATVSMEGILRHNFGKRIHGSTCISVRNDNAITVIKPPSNDWFQAPEIGKKDNNISPESIIALGRRKVSGRVLAVWNDDTMLLRTPSNRLVKADLIVSPPSVGAYVDVVGISETDLFRINLSHAIWRAAAGTMPWQEDNTYDISISDIIEDAIGRRKFDMTWHGRRIRMKGKVKDILGGMRHGPRILLEDGNSIAAIDCNAAPDAAAKLRTGCIVSVAGVCIMDTENWNRHSMLPKVSEMFIAVSSPDDIRILATPPWWTPARLLCVIAVLILLIAAVIGWNVSLRTLSIRRGRELYRNQIERAKSELRVDERTRLAAELHDHLAQNLTAISYRLAAAERSKTGKPDDSSLHLATATRMLGSCRTELRRCLWDLRSDALDEPDFAVALRKSTESVAGDAELSISWNIPRTKISDSTAQTILSITRELVSNAVHHGKARAVRISGEFTEGALRLSVTDDGCGFIPSDAQGAADGHFGLDGIRERLRRHGGEMHIESAPGRGTSVFICMQTMENGHEKSIR
jgi:signal transduction histidine kinase